MNIDKLVGKRLQFKSLDEIVDHWIETFGKKGSHHHRRDHVVDYCQSASSWRQAVKRACDSRDKSGKMHNHQSRVKQKDRDRFGLAIIKKLQKKEAGSFDQLHDMLVEVAPPGIGPVTVYDVATRIAAYLRLPITSLYLHAGVRIGYYRLYDRRSPNVLRLTRDQLPKPLQRIPADECEDLLCTYRDKLKPWYAGEKK